MVVALVNSSVVGLVSARVAGDRAWTQLVAISPQWRRKGIGSALARGLEGRLLHLGVRKISALLGPGDVDLAAQRAAAEAFARAKATGKAAVVTIDDLNTATGRTKASITPEMLSAYQAEVAMFERV